MSGPGRAMRLEQPLVDHHCHTVVRGTPGREAFERFLTEADAAPPAGVTYAETPLGLAVRRWCAPLLDLPTHAAMDDYLERRAGLSADEVERRLLRAAGSSVLGVDTGIGGTGFATLEQLGASADARVREIPRLETLAEAVRASGVEAAAWSDTFLATLERMTGASTVIGVKSVLAYRHGFELVAERPSAVEMRAAVDEWFATTASRLDSPVLARFLLWTAIDLGLPLQLHCGFGDRDLRLPRANPALLQPFLELAEPAGTPIVLLHCYPYHREAGWLAAAYPNVYLDCGLTLAHTGARAGAVLAEFCELAPFGKLLYSSDAYGLPELYAVGAAAFRSALGGLLSDWIADDAVSAVDAERIATRIASANAQRVYGLDSPTPTPAR